MRSEEIATGRIIRGVSRGSPQLAHGVPRRAGLMPAYGDGASKGRGAEMPMPPRPQSIGECMSPLCLSPVLGPLCLSPCAWSPVLGSPAQTALNYLSDPSPVLTENAGRAACDSHPMKPAM